MVEFVNQGLTFRQAAACVNVAPATAHRWWWRWRDASPADGSSGRWAFDRTSRPHRSPNRTAAAEERASARRGGERTSVRAGWPGLVGPTLDGLDGPPPSRALAPCARRAPDVQPLRVGEPGALLHMDVKRLARFDVPGHWATGPPEQPNARRRLGLPARRHRRPQPLAYVEQHAARTPSTNAARLERAISHFADLGLAAAAGGDDRQRARLRHSRRFAEILAAVGARHIPPRPTRRAGTARPSESSRPSKTNGPTPTAGRTHQQRAKALTSFIRYYNRRRPHSSLGDRPPISRVHNLPGQDT